MNRSVLLTRQEGRAAFGLFILYGLLNAWQLANFNLSIDDEYLFRESACHFADLGRWVHPLLRATLWPQPVTPVGPRLIFGALLAISFIYVLRLFQASGRPGGFVLAVFAAYATYPVWLAQLAFSANVIPLGIGVFCVSWAALLTATNAGGWRSRAFWLRGVLPASIACAVALGAYQSLGLMYLVIVLGAGLAMRQRAEAVSLVRLMMQAALTLVIGAALSWLAARLVMSGCHAAFSAYGQQFVRPDVWLSDPWRPVQYLFKDWQAMYFRNWHRIGMAEATFILTLLVSAVTCVLRAPRGQRAQWAGWLLVLTALPALLSLVTGDRLPQRTFLGAAAVLGCLLLLAYPACAASLLHRRVVAALAVLAAVQGLYVNSVAQARGAIVARHDQMLAAAIYDELARQNGGGGTAQQPLRVHFYGIQPFGADPAQGCDFLNRYYPMAPSTTTGSSFFAWDNGNVWRIVAYMNLTGFTDLQVFDPQPPDAAGAVYEAMPAWPAPGSVARFGPGFLVKLSPPVRPFSSCAG